MANPNKTPGMLQQLADAKVFCVIWGGGSATGIGIYPGEQSDNGWLAQKVNDYYQNPTPLSA